MKTKEPDTISIIGSGLSGSLLAIYLARIGFRVNIYEARPDMRITGIRGGRSINMALSDRGIHSLEEAGILEEVLAKAIPMKGRIIHTGGGVTTLQPYCGRAGHHINSISRGGLNITLMNHAEKYGNVRFYFNHRCTGMDFDTGEVRFQNSVTGSVMAISAGTVIATDGAGSAVRKDMLTQGRFNYSQKFLDHGYKELEIPPAANGSFRMDKNGLHIWPKGYFMLIALPNYEGSFTCTLFLPFEGEICWASLDSEIKVKTFFSEQFPDALEMMPSLAEDFFQNPVGFMATVKCFPWHVKGKALLLGDAAHAVVPFYGQGMNCAFEDCSVLSRCIEKYGTDWNKVFCGYEQLRKVNTDAIADLAEENFIEMRDRVTDPLFAMKRKLEMMLEEKYADYKSKYSLVTFSKEVPYSVAMERGRRQDELLLKICANIKDVSTFNIDEIMRKIKAL